MFALHVALAHLVLTDMIEKRVLWLIKRKHRKCSKYLNTCCLPKKDLGKLEAVWSGSSLFALHVVPTHLVLTDTLIESSNWSLEFFKAVNNHTGQCKRTGGCYNELVVAFFSTGGGVKGKKIYTCWLYYLFINLHLFYLCWHLAHRPQVTLQFLALPSNWWFNSWFGLQIQQSSGVLPWQVFFSSVTA